MTGAAGSGSNEIVSAVLEPTRSWTSTEQASLFSPLICMASEPQMPWAQLLRKVSDPVHAAT